MNEAEIPASKYVYCIIRCDEPQQFHSKGIGERGEKVYTVHANQLAAVVSTSPIIEYDSSRRNMMAHTLVLEEVMQRFAILPVRFGIIAPNEKTLQEQVLVRRVGELNRLLDEMESRIEVGLKAFWYEEAIFQEIITETPEIRQLRDSLAGRSAAETYYERIRLGEMIEKMMDKKRELDSRKIMLRLRPLAHKTRVNNIITDKMVLNAAFLVDRQQEAAFNQEVQLLDAEMKQRLIFKYVNSAPPYNFVNLVIHWEEQPN